MGLLERTSPAPAAERPRRPRPATAVVRAIGRECSVLFAPLRERSRWRPSSFVLATITFGLVLLAEWLQRAQPGVAQALLDERASLWWPVAVARLPGSMVAPALRLPMWGALAQVLFCFGLAEVHLGRRTTLACIFAAHTLATASARLFVIWGPHAPFDLGLAHWYRWQRDTGPSAAVVGVGTVLGVKLRLPILTSALVVAMLVEAVVQPDLGDREHLVAIAAGGAVAVLLGALKGARAPRRVVAADRIA